MATAVEAQTRHEVERFMRGLIKRNPGETEFHQAVREVMETLIPFTLENPSGSLLRVKFF